MIVPLVPGTCPGTVVSSVRAPPYRGGTLTRHTGHPTANAIVPRARVTHEALPAGRCRQSPCARVRVSSADFVAVT